MLSSTLSASVAVLSLSHLAAAFTCTSTNSSAGCAGGVHIIVARASDEPAGLGILTSVAQNVTKQIAASDITAVDYPATLANYFISETAGVTDMTSLVTSYVDKCPDSRVVLMGYSQGANVVFDTLIGNGSTGGTDGLSSKYLNNIVAAIAMGDPTHVPNQPYGVGNSTHNGIFKRTNADKIISEGLTSKIQSYCDADDLYCDSGTSEIVHISSIGEYGHQAVDFVVKQANAACGGSNSTSPANVTVTSTAPASTGTSGASNGTAVTTTLTTASTHAASTGAVSTSSFSGLAVGRGPAVGTIGGLALALAYLL